MDKKGENKFKNSKYWFEIGENMNEELERKREEFVRNIAQRETGISADLQKFPDGVKTGSLKRLPSNKSEE
ncbi:MAG: hypothetical protein GXW85_03005 [Clostridia bacterium]|nr:hypothetical protein [Clostridia bacterium]